VDPAGRPTELTFVLHESGGSRIFFVPEFRSPMGRYEPIKFGAEQPWYGRLRLGHSPAKTRL
jgi:hypothetical protein